MYLKYAVSINAESMALSIDLYIPQRPNAGRVIKDMFSLYRHLSEVELLQFLASRYNKLRFKPYNITVVDDMYPGFILRYL